MLLNMEIRLSTAQQAKLIADFLGSDDEAKKNAIAVFIEHDLCIKQIADMARVVA